MEKRQCPVCGKRKGEESFCRECGWDFTVELEEQAVHMLGETEKQTYGERMSILKKNYQRCVRAKEILEQNRRMEDEKTSGKKRKSGESRNSKIQKIKHSCLRTGVVMIIAGELCWGLNLQGQVQEAKMTIMRQANENVQLKRRQDELEQDAKAAANSGKRDLSCKFLRLLAVKSGMVSAEMENLIWR